MVVALETAHRGTEKRLAHGIDHIIQIKLPRLRYLHHRRIPRAHAQKRTGHQLLSLAGVVLLSVLARVLKLIPVTGTLAQRGIGQFVTGDLLNHKLIVRPVFVKSTDDIVTVPPHVGALVVVGVTSRVGVTGDIQPMLSPTLAVMRTGQQLSNKRTPCLGRILVPRQAELKNLKWRWR